MSKIIVLSVRHYITRYITIGIGRIIDVDNYFTSEGEFNGIRPNFRVRLGFSTGEDIFRVSGKWTVDTQWIFAKKTKKKPSLLPKIQHYFPKSIHRGIMLRETLCECNIYTIMLIRA